MRGKAVGSGAGTLPTIEEGCYQHLNKYFIQYNKSYTNIVANSKQFHYRVEIQLFAVHMYVRFIKLKNKIKNTWDIVKDSFLDQV